MHQGMLLSSCYVAMLGSGGMLGSGVEGSGGPCLFQVTIHCAVVLVAAFDSITESGLPAAYHMHAPL